MSCRLFFLQLMAMLLFALPSWAEERLALVIGNSGYLNVPALANPINDARLMSETLSAEGFRVTMVTEANRAAMRAAVEQFGRDIRQASPGAMAVFYFAGHGVRSDGFNYLVPLDVRIRSEADFAGQTVSAEWVLEHIEAPHVTSVMILDACRDNPFAAQGTLPEAGDGLARMTAQNRNLIAYATGPGEVALDGGGGNSPYATALARAIGMPGLDIEAVFAQAREEVVAVTNGQQVPWESSSLDAKLYLRPDVGDKPAPGKTPPLGISVEFAAVRWASLGCNLVYQFDPVSLPVNPDRPLRITSSDTSRDVALDLMATTTANGVELTILPVSANDEGRPITALLSDIKPGRQHPIYSRSRHPELFGCGNMTVYVNMGR